LIVVADSTSKMTRMSALRTYPCGCEVLRFGGSSVRYEISYCNKHRRVDVLCDQVRVTLQFLQAGHFSPPRVNEMTEALEAALRQMTGTRAEKPAIPDNMADD
jgi:hypothetical protein